MPTSNVMRRAILLAFGLIGQMANSADLPSGGSIVAGSATIDQSGANQVITQTTANAVINWDNFSIGAGNSVRINQLSSSSVLLNRVTGNNPSLILGNLSSNGQVFLVNPLGIYFGAGATVDVGGLVATTMNISNDDFMAGRYTFSRDNTLARQEVINQGVIRARENGYVVLAGDYAANRGAIEARFGTAALASGSKMTLDVQGDSLINFTVDEKTVAALSGVDNSGQILADGGKAIMTASVATDLTTAVVNNSGLIRASSTIERDGAIYLSGEGGNTQVSGTLDASGTGAGQKGGSIEVLGNKVALTDNAILNASGDAGGGRINVGGSFQGNGPLKNAQTAYIGENVKIKADAINNGNGGDVVIWSDQSTRFYGDISAKGGDQSGDGGNVEVSGKITLDYRGNVNTLARFGKAGTLLLDPTDIEVVTTVGTTPDMTTTSPFEDASNNGGTSQLSIGALETALAGGNVIIRTTSAGTAPLGGTITIDDGSGGGVQWSAATTLTLQADNNIVIKSAVEATSGGSIIFNATSGITTSATVRTTSGTLQMNANNITTGGSVTSSGGAITLDSNTSVTNTGTISSGGGVITLDGNQINIQGNINAGNGEVRLHANGITQSAGNISGNSLLLTGEPGGSGNWQMTQSGNSFNNVAINLATSGTVRLQNNKALTIGTVNGTSGISVANGNVELNVQGALSVANAVKAKKAYFNGTGGITQTAAGKIEADQLRLTGGAVTLENNDNKVGILSAQINGAFVWSDTNDILTIGNAYDGLGITTNNNNVTITTGSSATYNDESLPSATNKASLTLNESINAGSGTVRITTGKGGVFQRNDTGSDGKPLAAGSITANRLLLNNASTTEVAPFVLNNTFNRVNTLAGETTGSISYSGGALTIGSIDGIAGLRTKAKVIGTKVDPQTQDVVDIINDNNILLAIGGNLNINENLTATSTVGGSDTVNVGVGGDYTASMASGKIITAKTLGVFGDDGKGTFTLKSNVSQLAAGGGKKMVIDNSTYTGELTGIGIGGQAASVDTSNPALAGLGTQDIAVSAKPVGDFYLTTGGKLNVLTLNSKGKNLLLRSTELSILLDAVTANNANIMLQPFNASSSIGINNATEAGFTPGINYDAATLLKFKNPTATFQFGTAQNVILNDSTVDAAAKTTFTGDIHIGADGAFNLGYRSLSAQTTNNLIAYNVGPLYNLRLAANNLTINGFNTFGDQLHFFSNNLQLPGTVANYINPNKPNITLRTLNSHTVWIGQGLPEKPYEPHILPQTLVKLPDGSTIIISGSTDFPFPNGGAGNGDIHIPWNNGIVSLGNRTLVLSTGEKIYTYNPTPAFIQKNDGGKSGGLWQGCQNLATCKGTNPATEPPPDTGNGGTDGTGNGDGSGGTGGDSGSCATCPPAQPDPNYPTPLTPVTDTDLNPITPNPGTGNPDTGNPNPTPNTGTNPNNNDLGDGDGGGDTGGGGNGTTPNPNNNNNTDNDGNTGGGDNGNGPSTPNDGIGDGDDGGGTSGGGNGNGANPNPNNNNNTDNGGGTGGGGNGNGSGDPSDGTGDGGGGTGGGGNGNNAGDNGDGTGNGGNGNGSGNNGSGGSGDSDGDGGGNSGSGGNGNTGGTDGNGDAGNSNGSGNGGNGSNGNDDGDGDGGGSNASGGTGDGNDDGGNGSGSGGAGDGNGDGGNGNGGNGNGSGNTGDGNGDGGGGNGSGGSGDGDGDGDGGGSNGSGGTGDGNGDGGSGNGSGGMGDANGDGRNGNGSGSNGDGDGDGGSGNGSGGASDGKDDANDQSDTSSDTDSPAFNISCDDATEVGKRKERTDQKGQQTLVEVKKDGLKLNDPCQQQKKDDSRQR